MEVKKGYKQTEVGVIPEDWEIGKLEDQLNKIIGGGTPSRNKTEYWNGNIFWATVKDISSFNPNCTKETITKEGLTNSASNLIKKGTVIITARMALGKAVIYNVDVAINQDLKALFTKSSLNPKFLFYWFERNLQSIENLGNGSTVKGISTNDLRSLYFPKVSLVEQRTIAAALSDVDALISSLDQLIAKKRNIKQGTMQELLTGKKRLEGFTGEWDIKQLGDIFDFKNGLNKEKKYFGKGTPIVNYVDVYTKRDLTAKDLQGRVTVTSSELKAYNVHKDDVFFTRTSETVEEIGITSVITEELENTVFSGFVLRARPKNNLLDTFYKKYCFSSQTIRNQITTKSSYTTRALTNGKLLSKVQIPLPPLAEQQAITQILSDIDEEIEKLQQQRDKYKAIKQGMMQELLTGKTRLI